jgi:hypothetical protein
MVDPETELHRIVFAGLDFSSLRFLVRYLRINALSGPDGTPITLALPAPIPAEEVSGVLNRRMRVEGGRA